MTGYIPYILVFEYIRGSAIFLFYSIPFGNYLQDEVEIIIIPI